VFKAMLDTNHGFLESQEMVIDLGMSCEKYLKDFMNFLYEGEVDFLDVRHEAHYDKFCALITLGDKYQIKSLVEYILLLLTDSPTKNDVASRLKISTSFLWMKKFEEIGRSLMLWCRENMNKTELFKIASEVIFQAKSSNVL